MTFILSLMISMSLIASPVLAQTGEKKAFSSRGVLLDRYASAHAQDFEEELRNHLSLARTEGVTGLSSYPHLKEVKPVFTEKTKGHWEYLTQGNKISFSSEDLYQGYLFVNGKKLIYKNVPLKDLEASAEKLLVTKKTSLFQKVFGIEDAYACELVCAAVLVVLVAAIVGTAVYELMIKPEKMVKRLNEMKKKLDSDAMMCEESKSDQDKYEKTFSLASSISDKSAFSSAKAPSEALEYAIKKQLESGKRKNEDCFQIMHEVGEKVKVKIPIPTERQIQMRELSGGGLANEKVDVANAAFNLCASYNRLGSCMETFVAAHTNDSDLSTFKESATQNFSRYQRRVQGSNQ